MKLFKEKTVEDLSELDYFCNQHLLILSLSTLSMLAGFIYFATHANLGAMYFCFALGSVLTFLNRKGNIAHDVLMKAGKFQSKVGHTAEGKGVLPGEEVEAKKYRKRNLRDKLKQGDFLGE